VWEREELKRQLQQAYQLFAINYQKRGGRKKRERFCGWLFKERKRTLLEIGSRPGQDGLFFKEKGLEVVCVDLSVENIRLFVP
jgi:hypothetical protein